jgi:hypothetical protein
VFSDNLPRRNGKQGKINWKKSAGFVVGFIYEEIKGEIAILNYQNDYLEVRYLDEEYSIGVREFRQSKIGNVVGQKSSKYKFQVDDILESGNSRILKILEQNRKGKKNDKSYKYKCLVCGNKDTIFEYHLIKGRGCNVCSNKKVLKGYNDIHTISPSLGKLLLDNNDGYKYTVHSNKQINFRCNSCNYVIKNKRINSVCLNGLVCPQCSDGISYPNKLLFNILSQIKDDIIPEYSPEWAIVSDHENKILNGRKFYDACIPSLNCIIEIHGSQHYENSNSTKNHFKKELHEEQENDHIKEKIAKENGIENYIIIKADKSDFKYIKDNIMNSELIKLIDLDTINWEKAKENSEKSYVKLACEYWKSGLKNTSEIGKIMKLSNVTIVTYLKRGNELKWCDYNPQSESRKGRMEGSVKNQKPVIRFNIDGEFIDEFASAKEVHKRLGISYRKIYYACNNNNISGGFKWMYKNDYQKVNKSQSLL